MKNLLIFLIIVNSSCSMLSQEIFTGEYANKYSEYKSSTDLRGDKVFVQLVLLDDNTYLLKGYTYRKKKRGKIIINCSKLSGSWIKEKEFLILKPDKNNGLDKIIKYKIKSNRLYSLQMRKKNSRKTALKKAIKMEEIICPKIEGKPKNDLN